MPSMITNLYVVKVFFTDNSMTYFVVRATKETLAHTKVRRYLKNERLDKYVSQVQQPIKYTFHHDITPIN